MICVLKHKKSGKYVQGCTGFMKGKPVVWDLHGNVAQVQYKWNGNTSKVQFRLTNNMLQAKQVKDPDMEMVLAFGLEPIPIKLEKAVLKQDYRIIEHV